MVKVYADQQFIYVYFEWDTEMIQFSEENNEWVPFQCFVNSDGDVSTGGYSDDFSDACSDILLEGYLLWPYDPAVYPWVSGPNRSGWLWGDPLIDVGYGLGQGAGVIEEGKYEFLINRSMLSQCGYPIADVFSIGFEILQYWDPVGVLPNAPVTIDNPKGLAPSLQVVTFN